MTLPTPIALAVNMHAKPIGPVGTKMACVIQRYSLGN